MSTKTKQKKKTTDPLQSTGSTDEYETDDFSPSEESDVDNVAAASYNNRRDDYNGTPAATMRGGARSSQRGKNSSGKKKKNSFTNSSASKRGGKKSSSIDEVELLSSEKEEEDDSYEGDTETYDKKKSSKKGRAKRNNNVEDDSDNDMEEESPKNNKRGRRALGHINENKSNTSKSPVNGGDTSEGDGAGDNNTNDDDDSDDDSDPFANLGRGSNKRQKLQQKKNKGSDEDDSDSDSDDSDSDDSSMGMGLGRNRSAQLAKRRQKMMATHTYSSSDDDDDSSDSDDSLSDEKKKKKKPPAKKKSNALDDSDSSISFLGTQSRNNPSRKTTKKSPQKKPAATSNKQPAGNKGKRKSSILDTSCEILSSDDDFDLPKTITTTTSAAAKRSSPRKQPPVAASAFKKPMSQDTERDPSVRKASTKALDEARKAREALKAAQQYKAKEAVLPPIDVDLPSSLTSSRSRARGGGMEVVDVDMISSFPSQPSVAFPAQISYKGPRITLTLRYQNPITKKESKANIKIKTDQPLQHLVDEFKTQQSSLEITTVKFDGRNLSLKNTPAFYEMEDEDLVDVVVVVKQQNAATAPSFFGGLASRAAQALGVSSPPAAQAVTVATVHVQTRGNQSQKHTFQIKNDASLSKVVTAYCEKYDLISMRLEHNGRMLDTNKSLSAEGLPNEVHLDAVDLVQGGPSIKLKFRVYGKANDITTLSIPMKGKFVSIMGRFAQKKNLSVSQCKFIFDGETLNQNSTPEGLDLEGDEIIDVRLPESDSSSSSASATGASSNQASSATGPGRQISIQTNRNRNNNARQKGWKVHNTNSISKLQTDYIKYYKSKGCQTVKFYFRNAVINNMTQSFRELGVAEGAMIFAMENGKPYS